MGYLASALVLTTFCMKTMVPLRAVAILSNVAFIAYALDDGLYPVLLLHLVLLPLNLLRTVEMLRLRRRVEQVASRDFSFDWLRPFLKATQVRTGQIIFRKGDRADRLFLVLRGEVLIEEIGISLKTGDIFGEIGLFSADRCRTQSVRARTAVELLWISNLELNQICAKYPEFAFYFLRLITSRLISNAARSAVSPPPRRLPGESSVGVESMLACSQTGSGI